MEAVEATAANGRIEGRTVVQLIAEGVVNGMLADEAHFAAHLMGHEHLRAGGVKGIVGHHCLALNVEIVGSGRVQTIFVS